MGYIVGVMGPGITTQEEWDVGYELGKLITAQKWVLLTGGRNMGIMDAASRGAKDSGGISLGILPDNDLHQCSEGVTIPIVTGMGNARNIINVATCNVIIAFGGKSAGTISEIALAIKHNKPVILLNCIPECVNLFKKISQRVFSVTSPAEAIEKARAYE